MGALDSLFNSINKDGALFKTISKPNYTLDDLIKLAVGLSLVKGNMLQQQIDSRSFLEQAQAKNYLSDADYRYAILPYEQQLKQAQSQNYLSDANYRYALIPYEQQLREAQAKNYLSDADYRKSILPYEQQLRQAQSQNYLSDANYRYALTPYEQQLKQAQILGLLGDLEYKKEALNLKKQSLNQPDYKPYYTGLLKQLDYYNKAIQDAELMGNKQQADLLRLQQAQKQGELNKFLNMYRKQLGLE
ncbi:MAG: hypothetical protein QXW35_03645 [Candidatus Aenigmatarchaeota archaeon]